MAKTFTHPAARLATVLAVGCLLAARFAAAAENPGAYLKPLPTDEKQLIELVRTAEPAVKAVACKQLAIYGGKACVPEVAKLLSDEELASWARIPLEAIPDASAGEALRTAAGSLKGKLLVGVINSIGMRRDAESVGTLTGKLKDSDAEVASAAAVALGRVGNEPATAALRKALADSPPAVRSAVAEGCILCAKNNWLRARVRRRPKSMTRFARPNCPSSEFWKPLAARSWPVAWGAFRCWSNSSNRPTRACTRSA